MFELHPHGDLDAMAEACVELTPRLPGQLC